MIFTIGIFLFLSFFDLIFNQEITWISNLIQGLFLSAVMLSLLTFSDYKKLAMLSEKGRNQELWQRTYSRCGVLEISYNEIVSFLKQNKFVKEVDTSKNHRIQFAFQVNKYLPSLLSEIRVIENTVTVTFYNDAFFHFGAATSINIFVFLNELQVFYESKNKSQDGDN